MFGSESEESYRSGRASGPRVWVAGLNKSETTQCFSIPFPSLSATTFPKPLPQTPGGAADDPKARATAAKGAKEARIHHLTFAPPSRFLAGFARYKTFPPFSPARGDARPIDLGNSLSEAGGPIIFPFHLICHPAPGQTWLWGAALEVVCAKLSHLGAFPEPTSAKTSLAGASASPRFGKRRSPEPPATRHWENTTRRSLRQPTIWKTSLAGASASPRFGKRRSPEPPPDRDLKIVGRRRLRRTSFLTSLRLRSRSWSVFSAK